jgi:hypothetical protein
VSQKETNNEFNLILPDFDEFPCSDFVEELF